MKKTYYLFNPGRLSRQDNTLRFTPNSENGEQSKSRFIPVESVEDLYVFGSLDTNSALYNYLGQQNIAVHFFNYYENYSGSFMPKEYLQAGKMQVAQVQHYTSDKKRMQIASSLVEGASANMLRNLKYYVKRDKPVETQIKEIEDLRSTIHEAADVPTLMGIEGNIRRVYYQGFDAIIEPYEMQGRSKQPPENEINALVSFGNSMCYTTALSCIYHTQLNPTISFLHEPGARRFSLALDLAEIFKPVIVDRLIFKMLNKKVIQKKDFRKELNGCLLNDSGRKQFVKQYDMRLKETFKHRSLNRSVSYKYLLRLECYKLAKHLLKIEEYKPFKAYW